MKNKSTHGIDVINVMRKFLVIIAFAFWMGGFTFYSGVVVEVGSRVLESHHRQGMVTQQVTHWLNFSGVIALVFFMWNLLATRKSATQKVLIVLFGSWFVMALTLAMLVVEHIYLDAAIMRDDIDAFNTLHAVYLVTSTVQWAASLIHMFAFTRTALVKIENPIDTSE